LNIHLLNRYRKVISKKEQTKISIFLRTQTLANLVICSKAQKINLQDHFQWIRNKHSPFLIARSNAKRKHKQISIRNWQIKRINNFLQRKRIWLHKMKLTHQQLNNNKNLLYSSNIIQNKQMKILRIYLPQMKFQIYHTLHLLLLWYLEKSRSIYFFQSKLSS